MGVSFFIDVEWGVYISGVGRVVVFFDKFKGIRIEVVEVVEVSGVGVYGVVVSIVS